jgi:hypothetical protein
MSGRLEAERARVRALDKLGVGHEVWWLHTEGGGGGSRRRPNEKRRVAAELVDVGPKRVKIRVVDPGAMARETWARPENVVERRA